MHPYMATVPALTSITRPFLVSLSQAVIGDMLMTSAVISDFSSNLYSTVAWAITEVKLQDLQQHLSSLGLT